MRRLVDRMVPRLPCKWRAGFERSSGLGAALRRGSTLVAPRPSSDAPLAPTAASSGSRHLFQSRDEHIKWSRLIVESRAKRSPLLEPALPDDAAPIFSTIERLAPNLEYQIADPARTIKHTPMASLVQVTWPISTDKMLYDSVASLSGWFAFRMSKFYTALDALTGDVAYKHVDAFARGLAMVTAAHDHSWIFGRTPPGEDITFRCYVTGTRSASVEVRTDGLQIREDGSERLVFVCHSLLVVVDSNTLRPLKGTVPLLVMDPKCTERQQLRAHLFDMHEVWRRRRKEASLRLRARHSQPPTQEEMRLLHETYRKMVAAKEKSSREDRHTMPETVAQHTYSSCMVIYPESGNIHGKMFGGAVAAQAFDLAYFAAKCFMRDVPFEPTGLDEASFYLPVGIGDLVVFTARVVHCAEATLRVFVVVDAVHDLTSPLDFTSRTREGSKRTNILNFVFTTHPDFKREIVAETYPDMLLQVDAIRQHRLERLSEEVREDLEQFFRGVTPNMPFRLEGL